MNNSMYDKKTKNYRCKNLCMSMFAASTMLLAACASTPPPTLALQAAEQAIANAEQARVADYASPELSEAREKMAAAKTAVHEENMQKAQRLAEQARVDAELALAKSGTGRANTVNDEMQKSTETIRQEMQRNTGARQ
ncbi:MAG TPA: DUF4398 domain-containing protein [Pseudomonadales bacterium]|nr:DUF4398 domain-containing protein [Pseudomonadales bacterium]